MPSRKHFLALDLGTGSCKTLIFDERGTELGYEARECHPAIDPRYQGSSSFDTECNLGILCEFIRGAIKKSDIDPSQIAAAIATGMQLGTVFYYKDGNVLFACTNSDSLTDKQTAKLNDRGLGSKIYEIDGDGTASVTPRWNSYGCVRTSRRRSISHHQWAGVGSLPSEV